MTTWGRFFNELYKVLGVVLVVGFVYRLGEDITHDITDE